MLLLRQHELYKFQIHVLPLPPANFVHVTPGQWADHNVVKSFLMLYTIITNFSVYSYDTVVTKHAVLDPRHTNMLRSLKMWGLISFYFRQPQVHNV